MRKTAICFFILLSGLRAMALDAVVSHAVFYINDPAHNSQLIPNVEISWQVNPHKVHYTTTSQKTIIARIRTDIVFSNNSGTIKEDHFILQTVPSKDVNELAMHNIIDLRRYAIGTGLIKMKFTLTDQADTTSKFTYTDTFTVLPPRDPSFFSDLQLLDTIIESPAQTWFLKNGHQQVPTCTNFIGDNIKVLHYYAELYGADQISKVNYPLVRKVTISKKQSDDYYGNFIKTDTVSPEKLSVASGSFSLAPLPSGNYYLNISIENKIHKTITSGSLFFQVMNLHPIEEEVVKRTIAASDTAIENIKVLDLDKTFLSKYTTTEIIAILKMMLPVSDPMETQTINNFIKKPDDMYMRYYIYNHFKSINQKEPGKAWKEYSEKVIEVNKLFSVTGTKGYQSDRGFIYLRYGAPTEKVTVENESGTLPYEVWQYNTLSQMNHKDIVDAVFLFYKHDDMTSDYKLLHSNVSGETQNPGWRSFLYTTAQGGNNADSRAEQYIGTK